MFRRKVHPGVSISTWLWFRLPTLTRLACLLDALSYDLLTLILPAFSSILGFTIDRFLSAKKPQLVAKYCCWAFSRKAVMGMWVFAVAYCSPWLGLTQVKPFTGRPNYQICDFRLSHQQYSYFFITDMVLFYVIPLIVAAVVFLVLGRSLYKSIKDFEDSAELADEVSSEMTDPQQLTPTGSTDFASSTLQNEADSVSVNPSDRRKRFAKLVRSRTKVMGRGQA